MLDILITIGTVYLACCFLASLIVMAAIYQQWQRFNKKWNEMNQNLMDNNWSNVRRVK